MSVVTERIELLITSAARGVANDIRGVGAELDGTAPKLSLMQQGLNRVGLAGVDTGTIMKTALAGGVAVGGVAIAKFALDGVEKFAALTGEVRGFQRVAQTSAEDSSKLVFASKELGISAETAASSFGRLAQRIGTHTADLGQFGIKTEDANGKARDMAAIVADLSEKFQSAGSAQEKANIGAEAFGKSWQTLVPLLSKGKVELNELYAEAAKDHQIFSQDDLEKGRQFTMATRELSAAWEGLQVEAGSQAVPAITAVTKEITRGIQVMDAGKEVVGGFAGKIAEAGVRAMPIVGPLAMVRDVVGDVAEVFGIGGDAADTYKDKQDAVKDATKKLADAQTEHGAKSREVRDAQHELSTAMGELKSANDQLIPSLDKANQSLQTQAEKLLAAQSATLAKMNADLAAQGALLGVDAALDSQGDKLLDYVASSEDASVSAEDLSDKHRELESAVLNTTAAAGAYIAKKGEEAAVLNANAPLEDQAKARTDAQRGAYDELIAKYPELKGQLAGYLDTLAQVPAEKRTYIAVDLNETYRQVVELISLINNIPDKTVRVNLQTDVASAITSGIY